MRFQKFSPLRDVILSFPIPELIPTLQCHYHLKGVTLKTDLRDLLLLRNFEGLDSHFNLSTKQVTGEEVVDSSPYYLSMLIPKHNCRFRCTVNKGDIEVKFKFTE